MLTVKIINHTYLPDENNKPNDDDYNLESNKITIFNCYTSKMEFVKFRDKAHFDRIILDLVETRCNKNNVEYSNVGFLYEDNFQKEIGSILIIVEATIETGKTLICFCTNSDIYIMNSSGKTIDKASTIKFGDFSKKGIKQSKDKLVINKNLLQRCANELNIVLGLNPKINIKSNEVWELVDGIRKAMVLIDTKNDKFSPETKEFITLLKSNKNSLDNFGDFSEKGVKQSKNIPLKEQKQKEKPSAPLDQLQFCANELNIVLGLSPKIDIEQEALKLKNEIRETSELIELNEIGKLSPISRNIIDLCIFHPTV